MKKGTIEISKDKKGQSKATVKLEDELTYMNALELKDEVLRNLSNFDQLHIFANLSQIDLTGIQMLYSIKKSCSVVNKQVVFSLRMNEELENLIVRSGFKELLN